MKLRFPFILSKHRAQPRCASKDDWIIDLGPEGGDKGGEVVAEGTPEEVAASPRSFTGAYLKDILARSKRTESGPAMKLTKSRSRVSKREHEAAE